MELILRVDRRGRIVIPSKVRKALGIGRIVKMQVKNRTLILEPVEDPLEELSKLVVKTSLKASIEPGKLGRIASEQLIKETG